MFKNILDLAITDTSWQIDGETVETVADFILGGSKTLEMVIAAMKLKDTP